MNTRQQMDDLLHRDYSALIAQGDALRDAGTLEAAIDAYGQAILSAPDAPQAHYKLGTALTKADDRAAAMASYREALRLLPGYPQAANNLALLLVGVWKFDEAEEFYRIALAEDPDYPEAHLNLGNLLLEKRRVLEAIYCFRRALALKADWWVAWSRLGMALSTRGHHGDALTAYRHALSINEKDADTWNDFGTVCYAIGRHAEAERAYLRALAINPNHAFAWTSYLLGSNYSPLPRDEVAQRHRSFGNAIAAARPAVPKPPVTNVDSDRKLRIGFVSGDFRLHSVSYFIEPVLRELDRDRFELWAYSSHPAPDQKTVELLALFSCWRDVKGLTDDGLDERIRRDRIDILVDLAGHTAHSKISVFARKPAPIQVTWIGYPNTTGLDTMDYRITDAHADPDDSDQDFHTETLWRLPSGFLAYLPPKDAPPVSPPPVSEKGYITFGSFNARSKLDPKCLALWGRVLDRVPDSILLLKSVIDLSTGVVKDELLNHIAAAGIDPDRVVLIPTQASMGNHLTAYDEVDIALDTSPYNGTTTTCEALWMGVPVVTLAGDRHVSRVGDSLLWQAGLSECVAHSESEFVEIAARLAGDPNRLSAMRAGMRDQLAMSPLLDGRTKARELEGAFCAMWKRYCLQTATERDDPSPLRQIPPGNWLVELRDGNRIVVSDDYRSISTWVALEQEDWFEDEIRFLRTACRPGWTIVDVGANHGVYSLALSAAGASRVIAFEPTSEPLRRFQLSANINGYGDRLQIYPLGLSDSRREAAITLSPDSELNSLVTVAPSRSRQEIIQLTDIDSFVADAGLGDITVDFIKLDAEGEEAAILRGGGRFFEVQSPLVMFEFKHGTELNRSLLDAFRGCGFGIFRLVPGAGCLVPVETGDEDLLDGFTLNLFACKADRADSLERQGVLARLTNIAAPALKTEWLDELLGLPLYSGDAEETAKAAALVTDESYSSALLAWCGSRRAEFSGSQRLALLSHARTMIIGAATADDGHPATALLAIRILADIGERSIALASARAVVEQIDMDDIPEDRPVPPATQLFDLREPIGSRSQFLYCSVLEFLLHQNSFSSCFAPSDDALLNATLACPDHTPEAERTALLWCARDSRPFRLPMTAAVFSASSGNLNPQFWLAFAADHGFLDDLPGIVDNRRNEYSTEAATGRD